jgi:hypothetical protein
VNATTIRAWLVAAAVAFLAANPIGAGAQTEKPGAAMSSQAYLELLRADLRRQKAAVIAAGLELSDREATPFWRVYRDYEADVARIADSRCSGSTRRPTRG